MIKTITDYLDATVLRLPNKVAFSDEFRSVTFQEVRNEARKVASALVNLGIHKQPVAVFLDKRVECIHSMLGTAYSGNFYTVLDVHMPLSRIEKILSVLQPAAIITDVAHAEQARTFSGGTALVLYEDTLPIQPCEETLEHLHQRMLETDVLYVLFTSGSTGTPKGVIISHKAVRAYLEWGAETFPLDETTVFANQTPFYFVMSGFDIYHTIRSGATMYIVPRSLFSFPLPLLEYLKEHRVNTLFWVPSVLCLVANLQALPEVHLPDLRLVMFGGEVMPSKQLNLWRREYPDVTYVNQYGPTELTDICAYYIVDREISDSESLPIGIPCSHMELLLLDENNQEVPEGEIGEICGRGPSVAYGYYNEPEKTREVFVQNPVNTAYEEVIYRTGDLARYNKHHELIYISRKDFQIKHMGNRIELGEIETATSSLDGVEQNCCLYDTAHSKVVLFYAGTVEPDAVRQALRQLVPEYMVPNRLVKMDALPQNLNGKIDRAALKEQFGRKK